MGAMAGPFLAASSASSSTRFLVSRVASVGSKNILLNSHPHSQFSAFRSLRTLSNALRCPIHNPGFRVSRVSVSVSVNCGPQPKQRDSGGSSRSSPPATRISIPVLESDGKGGFLVKEAGSGSGVRNEKGEAESNKSKVKPAPIRINTGVKKSGALPRYTKAARRFYNEKFRAEPERLSKVLAAAGVSRFGLAIFTVHGQNILATRGKSGDLYRWRGAVPNLIRAFARILGSAGSNCGSKAMLLRFASRRGSEEIIFAGRVKVNGKVCKVPQTPVDPKKDLIFLDGRSLPKKLPPKFYFALNKPKGYICSSAADGPKPVLSLLEEYWKIWDQRNSGVKRPRLFTVGRLDVATSGLLLVTNDGDFAQRVSHPSSGLTKEYVATVAEKVTKRQLQLVADGTMVQGVLCVPTEVELLANEPGDSRHRIRIVVAEGRNREVRELVANAGLEMLGLKRVRVGGLSLSRKLGPGKYEVLTEAQVNTVLEAQT